MVVLSPAVGKCRSGRGREKCTKTRRRPSPPFTNESLADGVVIAHANRSDEEGLIVSETLLEYHVPVRGEDGRLYHARACGAPLDATVWEGWLEFDPLDGGDTLRSRRETTQPNRTDAEYWATGLSEVYLEGSLKRALEGPIPVPVTSVRPPVFSGPAPATIPVPANSRRLEASSIHSLCTKKARRCYGSSLLRCRPGIS